MADVKIEFGLKYGDLPWETIDVVTGTKDVGGPSPVVLYLHGGGFVACNSDVLLHSVPIPLARAGAQSFSMNYPLAPDQQFPAAVISTIRALAWVKTRTGAKEVVLMGDSAGGCIASTTAAILSSPDLLRQLCDGCEHPLTDWDVPTVSQMVSIYGVLDRQGWSSDPDPVTGVKPTMRWNDKIGAAVLRFCLRCYGADKVSDTALLGGKCILSDFTAEDLRNMPDTLLICGSSDPLIFGNRQECARIGAIEGRSIRLIEYPAHHAFIGFPIAWNLQWQQDTWPAFLEILGFLGKFCSVFGTLWAWWQWP